MNVCIFTFANACNYGAALQAYALQTAIEHLGHNAQIANYTPHHISSGNQPIPRISISMHPRIMRRNVSSWFRALPRRIYHRTKRIQRLDSFNGFQMRHLHMTPHIRRMSDVERICADEFVIGSDQVWNIGLTAGIDPFYWGKALPKGSRCVAYAPSAGGSINAVATNKVCHTLIRKFSAIGARESELARVLTPAYGSNIPVVIDPVMLLTSTEWRKISQKPEWIGDAPFGFLYRVAESEPAKITARNLARKSGLRLIELCIGENYPTTTNEVYGINPEEFLWLIDHAEFVVVASFHGTAFSLLFEKKFLSFGTGTAGDGRIMHLLDMTANSDRFRIKEVEPDLGDTANKTVDFQDLSAESWSFLRESLSP